ncbi:Na+/H+ antiporter subunit E [Pseudonocardia sp. NPDC049635]|uniref:Na+/H+ antiporter subunit E n=1 Tax=Pseudonocardia sp. NPDC049635 TaxID=3155506 RepID=UPI0033C42943
MTRDRSSGAGDRDATGVDGEQPDLRAELGVTAAETGTEPTDSTTTGDATDGTTTGGTSGDPVASGRGDGAGSGDGAGPVTGTSDTTGRTPARVPPPVPDTTAEPMAGSARIGDWRRRVPQVLALAAVWVLLWGSLTPMAIVGGVLVGLLVTVVFPLPVLPERLPVRPVKALRLIGYLMWDLVASGVRVSAVTLMHGPRAKAGILGLPLYSSSDRTTTTIIAACALTPGSYVLQVDRRRGRWYVYALGLHRDGAVERVRREMMNLQLRVVEALGTEDDVRRCREAMEDAAPDRKTRRSSR